MLHPLIRLTSKVGSLTCSVKDIKYFGGGSVVSVAAPQLCHAGSEEAIDKRSEGVQLCSVTLCS